jgi:hypothetical protein
LAAVADPRQMTTFHYFSAEMNQETAHECWHRSYCGTLPRLDIYVSLNRNWTRGFVFGRSNRRYLGTEERRRKMRSIYLPSILYSCPLECSLDCKSGYIQQICDLSSLNTLGARQSFALGDEHWNLSLSPLSSYRQNSKVFPPSFWLQRIEKDHASIEECRQDL